ncbi:hypothetical protein F4X90_20490 [Candidatus Poribacteria bacterium]|nr:hypothetical protein [Candidatus Poribacteria bacterium]
MPDIALVHIIQTRYARAFFVTEPHTTSFMWGEVRYFPILYKSGHPAATAYEVVWYANRLNADADVDRLMDETKLPSVVFEPLTPEETNGLVEGTVQITRPATEQTGDYANPVAVILLTQDTGTVKPRIYLLSDMLELSSSVYDETHHFRYTLGDPPIKTFMIEWYPTRLDAKRQTNRLTDLDRLPRADFYPSVPQQNAEDDELQSGTIRLRAAVGDNPYTTAVGVLCVEQDPSKGDPIKRTVDTFDPDYVRQKLPQWET